MLLVSALSAGTDMTDYTQRQLKVYVNNVIQSFSLDDEVNINQSMLRAMEGIPFDYGTGMYNTVWIAVIAEMRKRCAK